MKNLQYFVANQLSLCDIKQLATLALLTQTPKNGNSFLGDLMSALFPDDHHQRFPQLIKD